MKKLRMLFIALFFCLVSAEIYSETLTAESPKTSLFENREKKSEPAKFDYKFNSDKTSGDMSVIPLLTKVGILLIGIFILFYFIKKMFGVKSLKISENKGFIEILSVMPLTQNKLLYVIEMADEIYVLGVTETNINLITKISEKDKIDAVKLYSNMNESSETKKNFFEHLMENLSKKSGKNEEKEFKTIDDFK